MKSTVARALEAHLQQIEEVIRKAEKLESRVDAGYRAVLKAEVQAYRDLAALWRERIERERS